MLVITALCIGFAIIGGKMVCEEDRSPLKDKDAFNKSFRDAEDRLIVR